MSLNKKRVTKKLFNEIIKNGKKFSGSFFNFRYIYNTNISKYAIVVPKKNTKKAVDRNKYKRRGYYILRIILPLKGVGIFIYKKNGLKASFQEIKKDIFYILKKTKII